MTLPEHLVAQLRWLLENPAAPDTQGAAAALADELAAWVDRPEGYVPREVLHAAAVEVVRASVGKIDHPTWLRAHEVLKNPPAWFATADFARMTETEWGDAVWLCRVILTHRAGSPEWRHYVRRVLDESSHTTLIVPRAFTSPPRNAPSPGPGSPSPAPSG